MPIGSTAFTDKVLIKWASSYAAPVIEDEDPGDLSSVALRETMQRAKSEHHQKKYGHLSCLLRGIPAMFRHQSPLEVPLFFSKNRAGGEPQGLRWTATPKLFFQLELPTSKDKYIPVTKF